MINGLDTPAKGRVGVCVVFVFACKYVLGHSRVSGLSASELRVCLLRHLGFLTSPYIVVNLIHQMASVSGIDADCQRRQATDLCSKSTPKHCARVCRHRRSRHSYVLEPRGHAGRRLGRLGRVGRVRGRGIRYRSGQEQIKGIIIINVAAACASSTACCCGRGRLGSSVSGRSTMMEEEEEEEEETEEGAPWTP